MTIIPPAIRSPNVLEAARWSAMLSASIAGLIVAVLIALMIQDKLHGPLVTRELENLQVKIQVNPDDDALKAQYRQVDAGIRSDFFTRHARMTRGSYLLLAAAITLVLSIKLIRQAEKRGMTLSELTTARPVPTAANYYAVGGVSLAIMALFGVGGVLAFRITPIPVAPPESIAKIVFPDEATLRANWPVFRGWGGNGIVANLADLPHWDAAKNESILWKTPVPSASHSSPIVWGDRVFLTGVGEHPELYCFSATDGKLLWTSSLLPLNPDTPKAYEDTGPSASTPATDGTNVYVIFASGDFAAFDFTGKRVWQSFIATPVSQYSYASSLSVYAGNVIVQWDMGTEKSSGSALLAFDGATGGRVWKTLRATPATWASPVVSGGRIFTMGKPNVSAYDAGTGKEIWHAAILDSDIACTPAVVSDTVYIANDQACVAAIANTGQGDVTKTAVKWKQDEEGKPDIVSPTSNGKLVWTITSSGTLYCFDATTGKKAYEEALSSPVHASPLLIGEFLFITDTVGKTHKISATSTFKELATSKLDEEVSASPAVSAGKLFIRTKKNLYCIGTK